MRLPEIMLKINKKLFLQVVLQLRGRTLHHELQMVKAYMASRRVWKSSQKKNTPRVANFIGTTPSSGSA